MKFAKELQQDLVPEWRVKYLDYKAGKKHVKSVKRAFDRTPTTPYTAGTRSDAPAPRSTSSPFDRIQRQWSRNHPSDPDERSSLRGTPAPMAAGNPRSTPGRPIPAKSRTEQHSPTDVHYGSFGLTPPLSVTPPPPRTHSFVLPAPAIKVPSNTSNQNAQQDPEGPTGPALRRSTSEEPIGSHGGPRKTLGRNSMLPDPSPSPRQRLRRMLTAAIPPYSRAQRTPEIGMNELAMDLYRQRERTFFNFLESELDKVESFYKLKEDQAGQRLQVLKEQLREMGDRRRMELNQERRRKYEGNGDISENGGQKSPDQGYINQFKAKIFRPGPNSRAISTMAQTPILGPRPGADASRDYIRRPEHHAVSYRTAKRKLKLAMQEFYRGLELLKSYALLNRTAFRKLNKKYDKAVNARPIYRFMNEKVNKSWFVNSNILEGHIKTVEDLYAEFFERGNHKIAVGKLKSLTRRQGDESGSAFRSGILIGTGAVFGIQGLTFGAQMLFSDDPMTRQQASYLLQIYGGYFLMLFLFSLFVIDCCIWTANKINYAFIFEFDPRHHLDWRQLAEFPSFFLFMLGMFMWLNFSRYGSEDMFLYYPVVLIGLSVVFILFPAPIIAPTSRRWLAYGHWRLLLAGLYPVEFRDFFLGDMYCSLTYAVCNVSLFFCIYANHWDNPVQCNSNHSRLLGFFGALPPIWRFLQCVRRYKDTRNIFPHLVNAGKYTMSIMTAVTLSLYRISGTHGNLAAFIAFATINGVYTSVWDLFMDFSLLQPSSRHRYLRDITALKRRWVYYTIMVADPILRFNWVFYAAFTHDTQHSSLVSFLVAFAEVFRRGIWALLRVENEHCANVAVYKASRDVPLPYQLEPLVEPASEEESRPATAAGEDEQGVTATATGVERVGTRDEEAAEGEPTGTVRRRKTVTEGVIREARSFSRILAEAHRQDFVKKRQPGDQDGTRQDGGGSVVAQSDDDDDEEEEDEAVDQLIREQDEHDAEEAAHQRAGGSSRA